MHEFRPGIGSLLAGLEVPVVPCAVRGTHRAMGKGTLVPRPRKIILRIGRPRCFAELKPGKESARLISRQMHDAVEELLRCK
jgi:1-acyl-sn-glycerol-3-phosphate acyltransferase